MGRRQRARAAEHARTSETSRLSRGLGPQQTALLELLPRRHDGVTVAVIAERLGLTERRARFLVASLAERGLVAVTVERVGTQPSGRPIPGNVVWSLSAFDDEEFRRYNERHYLEVVLPATRKSIREHEERATRCPCCGQAMLPRLSVPFGK